MSQSRGPGRDHEQHGELSEFLLINTLYFYGFYVRLTVYLWYIK